MIFISRLGYLVITLLILSGSLISEDVQAKERPKLDHHVVVLKDGSNPEEVASAYGIKIARSYHHALRGFSAKLNNKVLKQLSRDPKVLLIQLDQAVRPFGVQSLNQDSNWGLDRIDQRTASLDSEYQSRSTGAGVTVYVIDSGVVANHEEFMTDQGSRVVSTVDFSGTIDSDPFCPDGHGTHVAGIVGGKTVGVAKDVHLVSVRVLDCGGNGTTSSIVAGIDWVIKSHSSPAVANISLGGPVDRAIDLAVQRLIAAGVSVVAGAGNWKNNACNISPARVPNVITVAASDRDDSRWYWSNFGPCVDLFAPGVGIVSAWPYPNAQSFQSLDGSSMAAPFVSGAAALYLENYPHASPIEVRNALLETTTKNVIRDAISQNSHLLYIGEDIQTIRRDVVAPARVELIWPKEGGTILADNFFEVQAEAFDNRSISKIQFFVDGILAGVAKEPPFVTQIKISHRKKTPIIWAVAYDQSRNATASNPVKVHLKLK